LQQLLQTKLYFDNFGHSKFPITSIFHVLYKVESREPAKV